MALKLDPRVPMVWRTPTALQIGLDPVLITMNEVTEAEEHMLWALRTGISRTGLEMVAKTHGGTIADLDALLRTLHTVLLPESIPDPALPPVRITVVGEGLTARQLARVLNESDRRTTRLYTSAREMEREDIVAPRGTRPCELAVMVDHFVLHPALVTYWLRLDIPHLPIVFSDGSVTIGPFIEPGLSPCLYCLERNRTDADANWPAIASQLWDRDSGAETPVSSAEAVAIASRMILNRIANGPADTATSTRINVYTGAVTTRTELSNPLCGCRDVANAVPPGSGSLVGPVRGELPPPPTTRRVSIGRG